MRAKKTIVGILASIFAIGAIAQSADSTANGMAANFTNGPVTMGADNLLGTVQGQILANNTLINAELAKRDATIANLQNQLNALKTSGTGGVSNVCPDLPNQYLVRIGGGWEMLTLKQRMVFKGVYSTNFSTMTNAVTCEPIYPDGYYPPIQGDF